jgi:hypothetical protein
MYGDGQEPAGMPRLAEWKCHKVVQAAKILEVEPNGLELSLRLDAGPSPKGLIVSVDMPWWGKHAPKAGGYLVRYGDGYLSFSPAEAFESGYTLLADPRGGL